MAVYELDAAGDLHWQEQHLYGSSRLGLWRPDLNLTDGSVPTDEPYFTAAAELLTGWKTYELSNHLGNVAATVSDRRTPVDLDDDDFIDYYEPVLRTAAEYYPFGLEMNGREVNFGDYRFGFNGKEADTQDEWGSLTHYDYGFRIYNPAIARFLSVDPLAPDYPWYTPYQFAGNKPILFIDLDGLEETSNPFSQAAIDAWNFYTSKRISTEQKTNTVIPDKTFWLFWSMAEWTLGDEVVDISEEYETTVEDIPEIAQEVVGYGGLVIELPMLVNAVRRSNRSTSPARSMLDNVSNSKIDDIAEETSTTKRQDAYSNKSIMDDVYPEFIQDKTIEFQRVREIAISDAMEGNVRTVTIENVEQANLIGRDFVGPNYREIRNSNGKVTAYESNDGYRRYRLPVRKLDANGEPTGRFDANLETRVDNNVSWNNKSAAKRGDRTNTHLGIEQN